MLDGTGSIFTGDPARQVTGDHWYSRQLSQPFAVTNLTEARRAIGVIVSEGEGSDACNPLDDTSDLSHYFKFAEIVHGRRLVVDRRSSRIHQYNSQWQDINRFMCADVQDNPCNVSYSYSGPALPFHEEGWPMMDNPRTDKYPPGSRASLMSRVLTNDTCKHCSVYRRHLMERRG